MFPVRTAACTPVDSSPKCNNASSRADMSCLVESHGKDGKQRAFPTFPRHGYGDLYDSIPDIRCTWTLNVPCPIHESLLDSWVGEDRFLPFLRSEERHVGK